MTSPTVIRGVEYPSQRAAARALGIAQASVSKCVARGTLDRCGLFLKDGNAKVTTFRGMTFKSQRLAAEHFGVSVHVVSREKGS